MVRAFCVLPILLCAGLALASYGDTLPEYVQCVKGCSAQQCGFTPIPLPFPLILTRWTCADNCKYTCMHEITDRAVESGAQIHQYHGKWPFWRLLGMQEPASVLFSLMNLWVHVQGAKRIREKIPDGHPMKSYYLVWSLLSMNSWLWSAVFHTRDLPITEKLDYFSAALSIFYALYYTIIRFAHLYPHPAQKEKTESNIAPSKTKNQALQALSYLCIIIYVAHVSYLTLPPRFDYAYNIAFNLVLGLLHNALWLLYALPSSMSVLRRFPYQPKSYRPHMAKDAAIFGIATTAATALELFDFPPWGRVIDAHSLWHLSTVPIGYGWYNFLIQDALEPSWREQRA